MSGRGDFLTRAIFAAAEVRKAKERPWRWSLIREDFRAAIQARDANGPVLVPAVVLVRGEQRTIPTLYGVPVMHAPRAKVSHLWGRVRRGDKIVPHEI